MFPGSHVLIASDPCVISRIVTSSIQFQREYFSRKIMTWVWVLVQCVCQKTHYFHRNFYPLVTVFLLVIRLLQLGYTWWLAKQKCATSNLKEYVSADVFGLFFLFFFVRCCFVSELACCRCSIFFLTHFNCDTFWSKALAWCSFLSDSFFSKFHVSPQVISSPSFPFNIPFAFQGLNYANGPCPPFCFFCFCFKSCENTTHPNDQNTSLSVSCVWLYLLSYLTAVFFLHFFR